MNDDRFIPVPTASVLCGIGINGQLMHLAKKQRIAKLFANDLREYVPALWRSVIAPIVMCVVTARHFQSAARTHRFTRAHTFMLLHQMTSSAHTEKLPRRDSSVEPTAISSRQGKHRSKIPHFILWRWLQI